MIHSIKIKDFRLFKNVEFTLGKHITVISGKNAVGKSTLLALLGNSCELKKYKTIFDRKFRTEFSEIFKGDKNFDQSGSNKCEINFSEYTDIEKITDTKICRVTWPKERFRVITETITKDYRNSKKKEFPSYYLGLSRLYPVGEIKDDMLSKKKLHLSESEKKHFFENYSSILNLSVDTLCDIDSFNIEDINRKIGIGITTQEYSSITNSAGQDNLGQIILTIISFRRLAKDYPDYNGGILLIDELDATLHPVAQIKLVNYLYNECKSIKLQIIFTTHSESLLKYICQKTLHNKEDEINNYKIIYITKSNGPLNLLQDPSYSIIKNDLEILKPGSNIKKISVYSEDDECRWLFSNLISDYEIYVNLINIKLGCSELLKLNSSDPKYFSNILFVFDGDVDIKTIDKNNKSGNLIKLPSNLRPEELIYKFLLELDYDDEFWNYAMPIGLTKESLKEHGPFSSEYQGKERDRYKKWFIDNKNILEQLDVFNTWKKHNSDKYTAFINNFISSYNKIAKRTLSTIIQ